MNKIAIFESESHASQFQLCCKYMDSDLWHKEYRVATGLKKVMEERSGEPEFQKLILPKVESDGTQLLSAKLLWDQLPDIHILHASWDWPTRQYNMNANEYGRLRASRKLTDRARMYGWCFICQHTNGQMVLLNADNHYLTMQPCIHKLFNTQLQVAS